MDEATKEKIRRAHTGKKHNAATKEKISNSMRQYWAEIHATNAALEAAGFEPKKRRHTEETKAKISAALKGRKPSALAQQKHREYYENRKLDAHIIKLLKEERKGIHHD